MIFAARTTCASARRSRSCDPYQSMPARISQLRLGAHLRSHQVPADAGEAPVDRPGQPVVGARRAVRNGLFHTSARPPVHLRPHRLPTLRPRRRADRLPTGVEDFDDRGHPSNGNPNCMFVSNERIRLIRIQWNLIHSRCVLRNVNKHSPDVIIDPGKRRARTRSWRKNRNLACPSGNPRLGHPGRGIGCCKDKPRIVSTRTVVRIMRVAGRFTTWRLTCGWTTWTL